MAPITTNEFGVLKEGLLSQRQGVKPLSRFGIDFTLTPKSAIFGTLPFVGQFGQIGDIINQQQVNQIARKALGEKPRSTFDAFTTGDFSATKQLQQQLVDNYGPNYTRADVQEFGMKNFPKLDLAPLMNKMYDKQELEDDSELKQVYTTQPFRSGRTAQNISGTGFKSGISAEDKAQIEEDIGMYGFSNIQDAIKGGFYDDELKSTDQFAGDSITQSNIKGAVDKEGKNIYDPAFSRAVTLEQQGDTADAESTFICTALYKKGLLPRKIYLCDVIYGRKINFYTYKGYEIWGKWFAKKIETNKTIYNAFYPIFVKWSNQMAYEISGGKYGKNNIFIKLCKTIGEKISYSVGWISERRIKWQSK
tara:strand:- start:6682 stop:7770 length:1089 start_codon:yes stop_codon:yes gene_type:complete